MLDKCPKLCPHCGAGGQCYDSRQKDSHVRRSYRCESPTCGARWATAEFIVDEGPVIKQGARKVDEFIQRLDGRLTKETVSRAIATLTHLL